MSGDPSPRSSLWVDLRLNGAEIDMASLDLSASDGEDSRVSPAGERHVFPARTPDWNNLKVIHRNTLEPRSYFFVYDSEEDAISRDTSRSKAQLLTGPGTHWVFNFSPSPLAGLVNFHSATLETLANAPDWYPIAVPGMWQLQGFGKGPQYTNFDYPWPTDPPRVPIDDNECGRYIVFFRADEDAKDHQLRLRFEGVDAAFTVWLNDHEVGYSQGSRNPSEFDVTDYINLDGPNQLSVEVYQRCDGSYIEDQDQWWLSGIFRDIYLLKFPKKHIEDFHVQTHLDSKYKDAKLWVEVKTNNHEKVSLKLIDADGAEVATASQKGGKKVTFEIPVKNPKKWTAETPYLYTLVLSIPGCVTSQRVGFRKTELIDGVFSVNGNPIKIRGVNRHEHHPESGRAVPYEFLKRDLLLMKQHNINAIRTSHYINDPRLYDLADELGLWIMDEADLECHGFGVIGGDAAKYSSDHPDWEDAYIDRARQLVQRDKNHPSVIFWSLGNESWYGRNHKAMYEYIRSVDSTRLIHYEGDWFAQVMDVYSRMYSPVDEIINFAKEKDWKKPHILCEFAHAMGNGPGALREYVEAYYAHPRLIGGFVWEWANHGLKNKNAEGEEYYAYGGDFGREHEPHDKNFVMDGLCFSDHTPTPGLKEYKKAIEPVQTYKVGDDKVAIINRYDFLGLGHLKCHWKIVGDGLDDTEPKEIDVPHVKPHEKVVFKIKDIWHDLIDSHEHGGERYLHLEFTLAEETAWAPAGHLVAFGQLQLTPPKGIQIYRSLGVDMGHAVPRITRSDENTLSVTSAFGTWDFDIRLGALSSWKKPNRSDFNLLTEPLIFDFYRALTDNDRGSWHGQDWISRRVHQSKSHPISVSWTQSDDGTMEVVVDGRIAPPVLNWSVNTTTTFRLNGKSVSISVKGKPTGLLLPQYFARFGLVTAIAGVESVKWWGRGPGESYRDKKLSQAFGTWEATVDDLFVDYEYPQDGGNRTDVRWVEFRGAEPSDRLLRARFGDLDGASFQALHYSTKDLDDATHPYELHKRKREDTVVHLDWAHHGLGTGSCGPLTLDQYQLKTKEDFNFELLLD